MIPLAIGNVWFSAVTISVVASRSLFKEDGIKNFVWILFSRLTSHKEHQS